MFFKAASKNRNKSEEQCDNLEHFEAEMTGKPPRILFQAWRRLWRGKRLPFKEDLDPSLFKSILPDVFLYQYDPDKQDFFIRLVGDNILTVRQGRYKVGQYLDELMGKESGARGRQIWSQVVHKPCAALSVLEEEQGRLSERAVLPLQDRAGNLCVIGATQYHSGFVMSMDYEPLTQRTNRAFFLDLDKIPPR